ncbi:MAG: hypothetical protein Q4Q62_05330 [Thermoplasmata archaeon]|nr:hypothetical protein [Thermoplasmata archaeon]
MTVIRAKEGNGTVDMVVMASTHVGNAIRELKLADAYLENIPFCEARRQLLADIELTMKVQDEVTAELHRWIAERQRLYEEGSQ